MLHRLGTQRFYGKRILSCVKLSSWFDLELPPQVYESVASRRASSAPTRGTSTSFPRITWTATCGSSLGTQPGGCLRAACPDMRSRSAAVLRVILGASRCEDDLALRKKRRGRIYCWGALAHSVLRCNAKCLFRLFRSCSLSNSWAGPLGPCSTL